MTASEATIKKIRKQFKKVLSGGGADCVVFGAMDVELSGGTPFGRSRLRSVAVAAGRAIAGAGEADGFDAWVALLRERYAELSEEGLLDVSVSVVYAEEFEHRDVPLSQIDPLPGSTSAPRKGVSTETVQLCKALEARTLPGGVLPLLVEKAPSGRYTVIDKRRELYEAYRTLGYSEARCAVQPPAREEVQINLFCQASIKLCELLEGETLAQEATPQEPRTPEVSTTNGAIHAGPRPNHQSSENIFRRTAAGWRISYAGQTWSGKSRSDGLTLIQTLLRSPHKWIRSEVLLGRVLVEYRDELAEHSSRSPSRQGETLASARYSQSTSDAPSETSERAVSSVQDDPNDRNILDERGRRVCRKRLAEIKQELEFVKISQNSEKESRLNEEALQIAKVLMTGPAGQPRKEDSPEEKARKTAFGRYRRACDFLTEHNLDGLREHLKKTTTSGQSWTYRPETDVDWLT